MNLKYYHSIFVAVLFPLFLLFLQCDNHVNKSQTYISNYDIYFRDVNTEDGMFYIFNTKAMAIVAPRCPKRSAAQITNGKMT